MFRPCRSKEGKKVLDEKDVPLYSFKLFSFDINLLIVAIIIVNQKEYFAIYQSQEIKTNKDELRELVYIIISNNI